jgi:uncharacterized protein (DUF1684 family)
VAEAKTKLTCAGLTVVLAALAGCTRSTWPDPPAIDQAQYQKEYEQWRAGQQETARNASKILGGWPLENGDTAFGADGSLPIVLSGQAVPARAGVFRREGETVTVIPASRDALRTAEGSAVSGPTGATELAVGSVRLSVFEMSEGRRFVSASDEEHPVLANLPMIQTYPLDTRWRVAARFDAFDAPKPIRVADVRGGSSEEMAAGRLTFRVDGQDQHLTVISFPGSDEFFMMFKDATNATATYGSRILTSHVVANGEFTVLDFNLAHNPPCAYSPYTNCPLPPRENRLAVAIEAGEKRFPTDKGFPLE